MDMGISPVVSGLLQGAQVGSLLRRAAVEREAMDRQQRRESFEREVAQTELRQKLATLGARPVTAGDDVEMQVGQRFVPRPVTAVNFGDAPVLVSTPSDLKGRVVTVPGTQERYVLPSQDEALARRVREAQTLGTANLDLLRQEGGVRAETAGKSRTAELTAEDTHRAAAGVAPTAEMTQLLGIPQTVRLLPLELQRLGAALGEYREREAGQKAASARQREQQQFTAAQTEYRENRRDARAARGSAPSASEARLSAEASRDALVDDIASEALQEAGGDRERAVASLNALMGSGGRRARNWNLRSRVQRALERNGGSAATSTPAGAGLRGASPAPAQAPATPTTSPGSAAGAPKVAPAAAVAAYAKRKGVSLAQAKKDFVQSGYTVN